MSVNIFSCGRETHYLMSQFRRYLKTENKGGKYNSKGKYLLWSNIIFKVVDIEYAGQLISYIEVYSIIYNIDMSICCSQFEEFKRKFNQFTRKKFNL